MVPPTAALVIKALKEPKCDRKKMKNIKEPERHNGNISLDDVIEIAKRMQWLCGGGVGWWLLVVTVVVGW
ncbi:hypothetical protein SO802_014629 [Lithocarpus litseifolius]|uniref:Large ribosomal subunit protein uL11 C-terminal domain-containing protein n=1 Tax=Lithocarpus litseifolius TaxID=425828 RepID=A0AAW2CTU3_9ROSI